MDRYGSLTIMEKSCCGGPGCHCAAWRRSWREWTFMTIGLLQIISSFLVAAVYVSVRTLTTSLQHVENIPTYVNAIMLTCSGVLLLLLIKRRNAVLLVGNTVFSLVSCLLCASGALLTILRPLHNIDRFTRCQYDRLRQLCFCTLSQDDDHLLTTDMDPADNLDFVFRQAPSCSAITVNLHDFLVSLSVIYSLNTVLCALALSVVIMLIHTHQRQSRDTEMRLVLSSNIELQPEERENRSFILSRRRPPAVIDVQRPTDDFLPEPLFPRMTLPGLEDGASQSVGLPGNSHARLLRVRRCNSLDSVPGFYLQANQLRPMDLRLNRDDSGSLSRPGRRGGRTRDQNSGGPLARNRPIPRVRNSHDQRGPYPRNVTRGPSQVRGSQIQGASQGLTRRSSQEREARGGNNIIVPRPHRARRAPPLRHLPPHLSYLHLMGTGRGPGGVWPAEAPPPYTEYDPPPSYHTTYNSAMAF